MIMRPFIVLPARVMSLIVSAAIIDPINSFARKVPTWVVYILYSLPIPFFFYLAATGGMGVEPINALEREALTPGPRSTLFRSM